jgi:hypothetical protein
VWELWQTASNLTHSYSALCWQAQEPSVTTPHPSSNQTGTDCHSCVAEIKIPQVFIKREAVPAAKSHARAGEVDVQRPRDTSAPGRTRNARPETPSTCLIIPVRIQRSAALHALSVRIQRLPADRRAWHHIDFRRATPQAISRHSKQRKRIVTPSNAERESCESVPRRYRTVLSARWPLAPDSRWFLAHPPDTPILFIGTRRFPPAQ